MAASALEDGAPEFVAVVRFLAAEVDAGIFYDRYTQCVPTKFSIRVNYRSYLGTIKIDLNRF
eukprot:SAG11_NODE_5085_length_1668_cov_2.444232_4_plen_61_part_01